MEYKGLVDLHNHTTASDGLLTPSELVRYAKLKGLKAIAITDHDNTDGIDEAVKAGEE
jgi:PHP domain.